MSEIVMTPDEFEDERLIKFTQMKREFIVNTLMDPISNPAGLPRDEGSRIMLMQSLDGLSGVALKRQSARQKAKADGDTTAAFKGLAAEMIKSMVGMDKKPATHPGSTEFSKDHKQTYVSGELSVEQTVVDEAHIIKARSEFIQKSTGE